jgi:hypothetical protein
MQINILKDFFNQLRNVNIWEVDFGTAVCYGGVGKKGNAWRLKKGKSQPLVLLPRCGPTVAGQRQSECGFPVRVKANITTGALSDVPRKLCLRTKCTATAGSGVGRKQEGFSWES